METHTVGDTETGAEELPLTLLWGTWEMWCDIPQRQPAYPAEKANWLDQVKSIGLFDSAEGFWGIFNCTINPSQLPPNGSFYLFRKHIAPMWEHEANRRGGKWVIPFFARAAKAEEGMQPVDVAWQTLCLCAIGELFPGEEEEICGVTVSRGKQRASPSAHGSAGVSEWKLCLWTRSADDAAAQMRIAKFVRQQLNPTANAEDSAADGETSRVSNGEGEAAERKRRSSAPKSREVTALPSTITYVAHRELMEVKQEFVKGGNSPAQPFRPKYSISMEL
ncbi:eukaryotic translation initiation factor-like protein [Leptomonas pyrrhocoris]|uniref:Eukaryotic translation initiation factor-like protein n=1 Tax=Leptomonas pyrrhocoris TaxID=157538 RepID=A0A0N0VGF4_LEPPY|nr:eukaryotic translation initiation factor-like protein [Leptomonas pyrrhocoris]KPA82944.1 eukaryotic translation initiation factor-like protein [Leptomonas pyrrhocoris]|eukprot:XP_015661383.1 eukaryotic translation initiation factor-like protein [Leptomonas pyrrhocoris]